MQGKGERKWYFLQVGTTGTEKRLKMKIEKEGLNNKALYVPCLGIWTWSWRGWGATESSWNNEIMW